MLAPRASQCLCLLPLKASGSFNLSFRKSQAGERNWIFTCRLGPLSTSMRHLKLSASWEQPPLLADSTKAGSRICVVIGGLHTFQTGRAYVLQEIVRWEGLPDFLRFLPLNEFVRGNQPQRHHDGALSQPIWKPLIGEGGKRVSGKSSRGLFPGPALLGLCAQVVLSTTWE